MNLLGIIDWGIGGIGVVKVLKKELGDLPVVYFSDTGVTPYGKMTRSELVSRLNVVIAFLRSQGITHLVIGCNAASTAIHDLADQSIEIKGVIETAVGETIKLEPGNLGLIGGQRTVRSGVYRKAFARHGIDVKQRIAQPLSGLIESGDVSSKILRAECKKILKPLSNCSHILLACTHYPAISSVIKDFVSDNTVLIDPLPALADVIQEWSLTSSVSDIYLTSGNAEQMKTAAKAAFSWMIENVVTVEL